MKRVTILLGILSLLVLSLVPVVNVAAQEISSVCLVTDVGRVNDGTFNQFAFEGMQRAAEEFNLDSTFIETQAQTDYETNINTCVNEGFDIVVTVGFLIADATRAAAEANPDVFFIGVDQFFEDSPPNLVGIQYREDQAGFLVGALAALIADDDASVAGVYGIAIPPVVKFRNGYEQGVRYINERFGKNVSTLGVYIDDFVAPDRGAAAAEQFAGEGNVQVIFGAGGPTGSGGILWAAQNGILAIGVDQDEYFTTFGGGETPGAENLISSAMKRVDVGVFEMIRALVEGDTSFVEGDLFILDVANGGIDFAPPHDADVPAEITGIVSVVRDALAAGLDTGVDPVSGELLEG